MANKIVVLLITIIIFLFIIINIGLVSASCQGKEECDVPPESCPGICDSSYNRDVYFQTMCCQGVAGDWCDGDSDCDSGNCLGNNKCCNTACTDPCYECSSSTSYICTLKSSGRPNGCTCSTGGQCSSGHCVDGVCCNTACTSDCYECSTGTCTIKSSNRPNSCPCDRGNECSSGVCIDDDSSCGGMAECQTPGVSYNGYCCSDDSSHQWTNDGIITKTGPSSWHCDEEIAAYDNTYYWTGCDTLGSTGDECDGGSLSGGFIASGICTCLLYTSPSPRD